MTVTRVFGTAPSPLPLLAKAVLPALPVVGQLPGIKHTGKGAPDLVLELRQVATDPGHLAQYRQICGYAESGHLPPLYPHFAAFGLHLALLTDTSFPMAPMGVVHLRNRLAHHRPIGIDETFDLTVRASDLRPHPKGRLIDVTTTATADGTTAWEETMTVFARGRTGAGDEPTPAPLADLTAPAGAMQWELSGDLGRRFAAVCGDRNPIHLHPMTAKAFGFPTAIAHGMWTKSRCLAALANRLPGAYRVEVEFRKPVLLPSTVTFGFTTGRLPLTFGVTETRKPVTHLVGRVTAL